MCSGFKPVVKHGRYIELPMGAHQVEILEPRFEIELKQKHCESLMLQFGRYGTALV